MSLLAFVAGWLLPAARLFLWPSALIIAGLLCVANAMRCRRLHCHITGPLFLIGGVVSVLRSIEMVTWSWNVIGATVTLGIMVAYLPECFVGRYVRQEDANVWGHLWLQRLIKGEALTKEQLEFLQSGTLDAELDKLTAPREEGRVDEFELRVNEEQLAKIEANERRFFIHSVHEVTSTKDNIWMEGTLNSLSKTGYRGTFHTVSGKHIPYAYVGDDPQPLLDAFAFQGPVRVKCNVKFDEDLDPMRIDILTVEARQPPLFGKQ